jgi:hypothetical protein
MEANTSSVITGSVLEEVEEVLVVDPAGVEAVVVGVVEEPAGCCCIESRVGDIA